MLTFKMTYVTATDYKCRGLATVAEREQSLKKRKSEQEAYKKQATTRSFNIPQSVLKSEDIQIWINNAENSM